MHKSAYELMTKTLLAPVRLQGQTMLDVGSFDVNGSYRDYMEKSGVAYIGVDIAPGKNVDIVSQDPYRYPFPDGTFDIVISGSAMEHVEKIWLWVPELVRLLRPGGFLAITTHWQFKIHQHPVDCWRILPDGMKLLFDETGELERYHIEVNDQGDIGASAWKKGITK